MSLLNILFPAIGLSSNTAEGKLLPGGNPQDRNIQRETAVLSTYAVIPKKVDKEALLKLNKRAASLAGQTYMTQKYSNLALQAADSAIQLEEIKSEHSIQMMEKHRKHASIQAKHGRAVQRHQLSTQLTTESYNAYSHELQQSSNLVDRAFQ